MLWLLFLVIISNSALCRLQIKNDLEVDYRDFMKNTIVGVLNNVKCIQLVLDANLSEQIIRTLYETLLLPVSRTLDRSCKGIIIVSYNELLLKDYPYNNLTPDYRILVLILDDFNINNVNVSLLGYSQVLITNMKSHHCLKTAGDFRCFDDLLDLKEVFSEERELPNFEGRKLRIGTFNCPPYSYIDSKISSEENKINSKEGKIM